MGGLGSVLTGDAVLEELLSPTFAPGLRVLHSDGSELTPRLLTSGRMHQVLASLCREADLVIVEAPPVLGEPATLALATMSDGVLVVAAADRTKVTALHETRYRLERAGAKVIGAVLNGVDETRFLFDSYAERREFRYADGFETEVTASPDH
jgi:Mrp family chromosome partitioning ATPase